MNRNKYKTFFNISLLLGLICLAGNSFAAQPRSGYEFLKANTRAMQDDDFANPGLSALEQGRKTFHEKGNNEKSCATCHGENGGKLDPKSIARYPIYNKEFKKPFTLQEQINYCWEEHLDNVPFVYDCVDLLEIEIFVRNLAKGEKVMVSIDKNLEPYFELGKKLYHTRFGQMNMACAYCHDHHSGQMLRGQLLSQGQSNGFPVYRLGSGKITGLHSRITECFGSFRAEPYERGSKELISLEVYLHHRGNGLPIETPAVRY